MYKILIVEDESLILKALEFRLKRDGYEVIKAVDGREGLKMIESEDFQLMITDMMLPFNNGLEVVNKAKEVKGKNFPVIVLSNVGLENVVLEAFKLGADDYITKPFSPAELSIRVKRLLNQFAT
jgi:two-component system response regulator VicR